MACTSIGVRPTFVVITYKTHEQTFLENSLVLHVINLMESSTPIGVEIWQKQYYSGDFFILSGSDFNRRVPLKIINKFIIVPKIRRSKFVQKIALQVSRAVGQLNVVSVCEKERKKEEEEGTRTSGCRGCKCMCEFEFHVKRKRRKKEAERRNKQINKHFRMRGVVLGPLQVGFGLALRKFELGLGLPNPDPTAEF